ncbi:glycosyltransferase [bacterium]|nr:glycosyltransferase [bacterium]
MPETDLSIIIPVFNESRKIAADIREAGAFLERHGLSGEIIVSDDGSGDGTADIAESCETRSHVRLTVLRCGEHRGKGHAVRSGMASSTGDIILFIDSGLCIPYEHILRGLDLIRSGVCDIAHASRKLKESRVVKGQRLSRRLASSLFHRLAIGFFHVPPNLTDTQAGLKIYRGDTGRMLYRQCRLPGFLFDLDIILRAVRSGFSIREFPVDWTVDPDSRLSLIRSSAGLLREWIAFGLESHQKNH